MIGGPPPICCFWLLGALKVHREPEAPCFFAGAVLHHSPLPRFPAELASTRLPATARRLSQNKLTTTARYVNNDEQKFGGEAVSKVADII